MEPTHHRITQRLHALTFLVATGPLVCDSFCLPCSRGWLAIISGCVLCYSCAAEPSHNNVQTEASHALRQHDSTEHQWLAYIQLAQLLLDRQLGFLVFARSSVLLGTCTEWQYVPPCSIFYLWIDCWCRIQVNHLFIFVILANSSAHTSMNLLVC